MVPYAELHCHSNASFLDGGSHPEELAEEAARLRLEALAITDHDGMYGIVRFAEAARALGLPTIFGAELTLTPELTLIPSRGRAIQRTGTPDPGGEHLVVLARGPEGYARLCRAISEAQMAGGKGAPRGELGRLAGLHGGHWVVLTGCRKGAVAGALAERGPTAAQAELDRLVQAFGRDNVYVEIWDHGDPLDSVRNDALVRLADRARVEVVATNNVHYATPGRRRLATALAAVRARSSLADLDGWLPAGAGAHLRSGLEQATRLARYPGTVELAADLGRSLAFDLELVAPRLPDFPVPPGHTEMSWLRELAVQGATRRYGPRHAERTPGAWRQIDHELAMIEQLGFPGYFLIVWDIVEFCRRADIYCQGRGSAANSAVCYAIGITKADAVSLGLLFERFLSPERDGPPDIDLDIEAGRREEVIQYVYERYGRDRAAQVANVITYQARSAVRDMGRALGYAPGQLDAWSKQVDAWGPIEATVEHEIPEQVMELARQVQRFPRHLGIHSGGMVICDRPVVEVCPVEWATMKDRSVLQWDKDDCAAVGLVKFDLLGLGMLSALHDTVDLVRRPPRGRGRPGRAAPGGGRLRDAVRGRLGRGVPGREPGPDGHPAPAQAAGVLRPGGGGGPDPAGPDPGRLGPSLHPPPQRRRAGHLPAPAAGAVPGKDPRGAAVPGAAHADGRGRRRVQRRRGRPAAPGHGGQALQRAHGAPPGPAVCGHGRAGD